MSEENLNRAQELIDKGWNAVCDEEQIKRLIVRISHEILERNAGVSNIAIVGIRTRGEILSQRIVDYIESVEDKRPPLGVVDITLYRDDWGYSNDGPELLETELPFNVDKYHIILVDDVLFTGRTIRAALDAIIDFGRPRSVQLAVLCDRGHRELPIRADYVGKNLPTSRSQNVRVCMREKDGQDAVFVGNFSKKKSGNGKRN